MRYQLALLITILLVTGAADMAQRPQDVEQHLRRATQELLDAIAPGDRKVWETYLDEGLIHVDENGIVRTRTELLKELTPLPAGLKGSIRIASFQAAVRDDVAVATHEDHEQLDYHGQQVATRFRTTDTWIKTTAGWRLAASQVMAVLDDPPPALFNDAEPCAFAGAFALTPEISATIRCRPDGLIAERTGREPVQYRRESGDVFFAPGQPRTRRIFLRNAAGVVLGFADRREGHDIIWKRIVGPRP
jgi:Domain of unknown function (DUF4440)